jgi:hypothetical protein
MRLGKGSEGGGAQPVQLLDRALVIKGRMNWFD